MKPTGVTISIKGEDGEYDWKVRYQRAFKPNLGFLNVTFDIILTLSPLCNLQVPSSLPQGATFSFQISYTDPTTKEP